MNHIIRDMQITQLHISRSKHGRIDQKFIVTLENNHNEYIDHDGRSQDHGKENDIEPLKAFTRRE